MAPFCDVDRQGRVREAMDATAVLDEVNVVRPSHVSLNGRMAYWLNGPYEIVYITRDGTTDTASARLTSANTLIWDTPRVAIRLEGRFDRLQALDIAR